MKDCIKASADYVPEDPNQRVNYPFGMVLGAADFYQEQAHFEWKHRLGARLLQGYGTVCGLAVSAQATTGGTDVEIQVSPGYAISPQGRWIWVEHAQCGRLNDWLQQHKSDLSPPLASGRRQIYVTLGYAECPTDLVPIAGRACALEEDTHKPSRIEESFQLQFAWAPPPQPYEYAMRSLVELLRSISFVPAVGSPPLDDSELLLALVRELGAVASPPSIFPPASIRINQDRAGEILSRLVTVLVTEVYPRLDPLQPTGSWEQDGALLLATLAFEVDAGGALVVQVDSQGELLPGVVAIDERNRPLLVADKLQQALAAGLPAHF
jgi:hypothetical protein